MWCLLSLVQISMSSFSDYKNSKISWTTNELINTIMIVRDHLSGQWRWLISDKPSLKSCTDSMSSSSIVLFLTRLVKTIHFTKLMYHLSTVTKIFMNCSVFFCQCVWPLNFVWKQIKISNNKGVFYWDRNNMIRLVGQFEKNLAQDTVNI